MIVLDLPAPLSVNRTRRIDWAAKPKIMQWIKAADALVMSQGRLPQPIAGQFSVLITLADGSSIDGDNTVKGLVDYLRRLGLITNDDPRHMRRLTVEFGEVSEGCRVTIQSYTGGK